MILRSCVTPRDYEILGRRIRTPLLYPAELWVHNVQLIFIAFLSPHQNRIQVISLRFLAANEKDYWRIGNSIRPNH